MAVIGISLLHNINEVLEKINNLKTKLSQKTQELEQLQQKNTQEQASFKQTQQEMQIQNKILEEFNHLKVKFEQQEKEIRLEIAKKVEPAINNYLSSDNIKSLIHKIIEQNADQKPYLEADPELAQNLGLQDTKPAIKGALRVVCGHKSYVLDLESVKESLRRELTIRSI